MLQLDMDQERYRVGKTILFLQNYDILEALDALRELKIVEHVIRLQSLMRMVRQMQAYRAARRRIRLVQDSFHARDVRIAFQEVRWAGKTIQRVGRGYISRALLRRFLVEIDPQKGLAFMVRAELDKLSGKKIANADAHDGEVSRGKTLRCAIVKQGWLCAMQIRENAPSRDELPWAYVVLRHGMLSLYQDEGSTDEPLASLQLCETEMHVQNLGGGQQRVQFAAPDVFADGAAHVALGEMHLAAAEEERFELMEEAAEQRKTFGSSRSLLGKQPVQPSGTLTERMAQNRATIAQAQSQLQGCGPMLCRIEIDVDVNEEGDLELGLAGDSSPLREQPASRESTALGGRDCEVGPSMSWLDTFEAAIEEAREVEAGLLHVLRPEASGAVAGGPAPNAADKSEGGKKDDDDESEHEHIIKRGFLLCRRFLAGASDSSGSPEDAASSSAEKASDRVVEDLTAIDATWRKLYFVLYNDGQLHAFNNALADGDVRIRLNLRFYAVRELDKLAQSEQQILEPSGPQSGQSSSAAGVPPRFGQSQRKEPARHSAGGGGKGSGKDGMRTSSTERFGLCEEFFGADGVPYLVLKETQLELASGQRRLHIAAMGRVADDWAHILRLGTSRLYQKSPIFGQDVLKVHTLSGPVLTLPLDSKMRAATVVKAACKALNLQYELWTLHEQWDFPGLSGGASERNVPLRERIVDVLLLRWEGATRRRLGMVAVPPKRMFRLVLRKVASFGATSKLLFGAELQLSYAQAVRDFGKGMHSKEVMQDACDVCALVLFHAVKTPLDAAISQQQPLDVAVRSSIASHGPRVSHAVAQRHSRVSEISDASAPASSLGSGGPPVLGAHFEMGARASMAGVRRASLTLAANVAVPLATSSVDERTSVIHGQRARASMRKMQSFKDLKGPQGGRSSLRRPSNTLAASLQVEDSGDAVMNKEACDEMSYAEVATALLAKRAESSVVTGQAARINPGLLTNVPIVLAADLRGHEKRLLPSSWLEATRGGMPPTASAFPQTVPEEDVAESHDAPGPGSAQLQSWREGVARSMRELVTEPLLDESQLSALRRAVREVRMERELTATDAQMVIIDVMRRAPLCFSSEFAAEIWMHGSEATLPAVLAVNYAGLHIFSQDRTRCLFSFSIVNDLLSWVHLNDMLVIRVLTKRRAGSTSSGRVGSGARLSKKVHFVSVDTEEICALLDRYAEEARVENEKLVQQRNAHFEKVKALKTELATTRGRSRKQSVIQTIRSQGGASAINTRNRQLSHRDGARRSPDRECITERATRAPLDRVRPGSRGQLSSRGSSRGQPSSSAGVEAEAPSESPSVAGEPALAGRLSDERERVEREARVLERRASRRLSITDLEAAADPPRAAAAPQLDFLVPSAPSGGFTSRRTLNSTNEPSSSQLAGPPGAASVDSAPGTSTSYAQAGSAAVSTTPTGPAKPPSLNVSPAAVLMRQRSQSGGRRRSHLVGEEGEASVQVTDRSGAISDRSQRTRRGLGIADASTDRGSQSSRRGIVDVPSRERSRPAPKPALQGLQEDPVPAPSDAKDDEMLKA